MMNFDLVLPVWYFLCFSCMLWQFLMRGPDCSPKPWDLMCFEPFFIYFKIHVFHPSDLWLKSRNDRDILNLKGLKLTAFPFHAQSQQKNALFQLLFFCFCQKSKETKSDLAEKGQGQLGFSFSNSKFYGTIFDLAIKVGQSQPMIIKYIYFIILDSQLLQMKFQGNLSSGSEGKDFFSF